MTMASCKECDRQIVCRYYTQWANVEQTKTDRCQYFKNKSDFQEVKHGEWIENGLYCSVCGYLYDTGEYKNSHNYCPDCGADMRKEKDKCVKPRKMDGGKNE